MPRAWGAQERILVCLTPRSNAARHAGKRPAQRQPLPRSAAGRLRRTGRARRSKTANASAGTSRWRASWAPRSMPCRGRTSSQRARLRPRSSASRNSLSATPSPRVPVLPQPHREADRRGRGFRRPPLSPRGRPVTRRHPGHLKIFLGYAAGVGKTYRMLEEAQAPARAGRRRRHRLLRAARPRGHHRQDRRAGSRAAPHHRLRAAPQFEEMDTEADPAPQARRRRGGRVRAQQRPRQQEHQSAGRTSTNCSTPASTCSPP